MKVIFWTFIVLIIYCYFGYPLLLVLWAKLKARPVSKQEFLPMVSILMSVYNEADVIQTKLRNLLSIDYPAERMEIWIGSDGSDDRTNEIIRSFEDVRVHLLESEKRQGKMTILNQLAQKANNEIVVFTDARQMLAGNSIRQLVYNFHDPHVGCVSGELIFSNPQGATAKGISLYWEYEKFIRLHESRIHSMIGATGAIYAIRRELFIPGPPNVVLDDVFIPLKIVLKGYRAIFDKEAKAYDQVAQNPREEYTRKSRTLFGNYQIFRILPEIFHPLRCPVALQIFSHKFLRVMIPFLLVAIFILNLFLMEEPGYRTIFFLQMIFYIAAIIGALAAHRKYGIFKVISKLCYVPYVFCLLNFSAFVGFLKFLKANQAVTWEKARTK